MPLVRDNKTNWNGTYAFKNIQIVLTNKQTQESNVITSNSPQTGGFDRLDNGKGAYSGYADLNLPGIKTIIQGAGQAFFNPSVGNSPRVLQILTAGENSDANFRFESLQTVNEKPKQGTFIGEFFNYQNTYSGVVSGRFYRTN